MVKKLIFIALPILLIVFLLFAFAPRHIKMEASGYLLDSAGADGPVAVELKIDGWLYGGLRSMWKLNGGFELSCVEDTKDQRLKIGFIKIDEEYLLGAPVVYDRVHNRMRVLGSVVADKAFDGIVISLDEAYGGGILCIPAESADEVRSVAASLPIALD